MVHLILRYIFAMPLAPMMAPAEHKQVHTTRFLKILKQVCCLSFLCIRLMPSDVRNVWQPKAVFQPLFSSAVLFVVFHRGQVANQPAAARATLIFGACHAASGGNSKLKKKQLEVELKLSRPAATMARDGLETTSPNSQFYFNNFNFTT